MRPLPVVALTFLAACTANPMSRPHRGFLSREIMVDGVERRYVVYVPREYDPARIWPLVVFLNGSGECGTDGQKQLLVGIAPAIVNQAKEWPCLVLLAQKPDRQSAWEHWDAMVMAQLAEVAKEFSIDPKRISLTGLSQGGHGTWALGARHKDRWSALAPICGYGDPAEIAKDLVAIPLWAFHGDADRTVPVQQSKALCDAVRAAGGTPKLTLYPGVGHNSWDKAYRDEKLAEWLLAQQRP